jgi:hypothetical protein
MHRADAASRESCGGETVSNDEGENLDFSELDLPEEDMLQPGDDMLQPGDDMLQPGDDMLQPADDMLQPADEGVAEPEALAETAAFEDIEVAAPTDAEKKTGDEDEAKPEEKRFGLPDYLVWAVVALSCVGLVLVDVWLYRKYGGSSLLFLGFISALWLILTSIPLMLGMGRRKATVYDYLLAVSLTGIVVGVFCLLMELVNYGGDITAEEAKQRQQVMAPAAQSAPASTTAAA